MNGCLPILSAQVRGMARRKAFLYAINVCKKVMEMLARGYKADSFKKWGKSFHPGDKNVENMHGSSKWNAGRFLFRVSNFFLFFSLILDNFITYILTTA